MASNATIIYGTRPLRRSGNETDDKSHKSHAEAMNLPMVRYLDWGTARERGSLFKRPLTHFGAYSIFTVPTITYPC